MNVFDPLTMMNFVSFQSMLLLETIRSFGIIIQMGNIQ